MRRTVTIDLLSTAVSPITHMSGTNGNEATLAAEAVMTPSGLRWVPMLSGNALRHRLVREPAARFLVGRWDLAGKLSMAQLNFLFHAGNLTGSTNRVDTAAIAEVGRLFPFLRLLGGSLPDAILPGSLNVGRGTLVCRENRHRLAALFRDEFAAGDGFDPAALRTAESFRDGYQYTRSDARQGQRDLLPADADGGDSNLMIFAGQCVVPGAAFAHQMVVAHASNLELGCLLLSLSLWRAGGATIGGQAARGHGVLDTRVRHGLDAERLVAEYVAHVDAVRDEAAACLGRLFRPAADPKPGKAKGKKGGVNVDVAPAA